MSQKRPDFSHSVGHTFKNARKLRGLQLSLVSKEISIPVKVLRALEAGRYNELPHNIYTLGFVRRYAKFLGLSSSTAAKKYLLERGPLPKSSQRLSRQALKKPVVGTRVILTLGLAVATLVVAIYIIWQIFILTGPPTLEIDVPTNNQVVRLPNTSVSGQTTAGADVYINGQSVYVGDNGEFAANINLQSGVNTIRVEARNKRSKSTILERTVVVDLDPS